MDKNILELKLYTNNFYGKKKKNAGDIVDGGKSFFLVINLSMISCALNVKIIYTKILKLLIYMCIKIHGSFGGSY